MQPIKTIVKIIVQGVILFYAGWVIFYIVARELLDGHDWSVIAATDNAAPLFGPIGVALLVISLLFRSRWLLVGLLAPGLIAFAVWYGPLLEPAPDVEAPPGSQVLQVASFNILSPSSDPAQIPDAIRELGEMDIVGLQEIGNDHAAAIKNELGVLFPHQVHIPADPSYEGIGLISRYPITTHEEYRPEPDSYLHLRAELDIDGTPIVVYVLHPQPAEHRTNPLRYDHSQRQREIQDFLDRFSQEEGPVLVLCDCNLPDQTVDYDLLDNILNDAFREVGWGMGFTFPAYRTFIPSLVRIDYVWYTDHFVALSAETAANPGTSDHRPIQAELALKSSAEEPAAD